MIKKNICMKKENKIKMLDAEVSAAYEVLKSNIDKIPKDLFWTIRKKMRSIESIHAAFIEDAKAAGQRIAAEKGNTEVKDGNEIFTTKGAKAMNELQKELDSRMSEVDIIEPRLTEDQIKELPQEVNLAIYYLEKIL